MGYFGHFFKSILWQKLKKNYLRELPRIYTYTISVLKWKKKVKATHFTI